MIYTTKNPTGLDDLLREVEEQDDICEPRTQEIEIEDQTEPVGEQQNIFFEPVDTPENITEPVPNGQDMSKNMCEKSEQVEYQRWKDKCNIIHQDILTIQETLSKCRISKERVKIQKKLSYLNGRLRVYESRVYDVPERPKEGGWLKMSNELITKIYQSDALTRDEIRIILGLLRLTEGYSNIPDSEKYLSVIYDGGKRVSYTKRFQTQKYLYTEIGLEKSWFYRCMNSLGEKGIVQYDKNFITLVVDSSKWNI